VERAQVIPLSGHYDRIGRGYADSRRPDPRIARQILQALGDARTIVNVGAGTGSYEPEHLGVVAVEPSIEMIRQRRAGASPVVQARAERLPFRDRSFDAAMALLTIHHWSDLAAGLAELRRVARRRVAILTWDLEVGANFWLTAHYLPALVEFDAGRFTAIGEVARLLGGAQILPVVVPGDCVDGFFAAFWKRPEAYLDPDVRRGMSNFAQMPPEALQSGLARLADDLRSGRWDEQFGALRKLESLDLGYRLVVAEFGR
jgi:SAM-dependent methyltransferase